MLIRMGGVLGAGVLVLAGCGSGPAGNGAGFPEPIAAETREEGFEVRTHAAELQIDVGGDYEITVEEVRRVAMTEILGGRIPQVSWFFQVGVSEPIERDTFRFQIALDVAPGAYQGPGTYELSEAGAEPIPGTSGIGSAVFIRLFLFDEAGAVRDVEEFNVFAQPCSLELGARGVTGHLVCPALALDTDPQRTVTLDWRWRLVSPDALDPAPAAPGEQTE